MTQNSQPPTFQAMAWHDKLVLDLAYMDDTHREFVDLLAQVAQASDEALLPLWDTVIAHTQGMDAGLAAHLRALGFDPETGAQLQSAVASEGACGCG